MPMAPPLLRLGYNQGVKASHDPTAVPVGALWLARNVRLSQSGLIRIRPGSIAFTESRGPGLVQGMAAAFGGLLIVHNRDLVFYDRTGAPTVLAEGVIGASADDPVEIVRWTRGGQEIAYVFSGAGLWETDGTPAGTRLVEPYEPSAGEQPNLLRASNGSQDTTSGPARSRAVLLRLSDGQRLVVGADPTRPNTFWMCDPLDASYWPADQEVNLPMDGGRLVALTQWYGAIIALRDRDVWAYFKAYEGDPSGKGPTLQDASIGCSAARTVVPVPGFGIVFLGGPQGKVDNVYCLTHVAAIENQVRCEPIGGDIRNLLVEAIEEYGLDGASAIYHDGEYRLSIPANEREDRVFVLDVRHRQGWFVDSGPRTTQYAVLDGKLYGAAWAEGRIHQIAPDVLRDGDNPIPVHIRWRRESLLGPARIKRLFIATVSKAKVRPTEVFWWHGAFGSNPFGAGQVVDITAPTGTDQTLRVTVYADGREFQVESLAVKDRHLEALGRLGHEPIRIYEARFRPSLQGHFVQLQVDATTPDEDIALLGYGIEYATRSQIQGQREGVTA